MLNTIAILLCALLYFPALADAWTIAAKIGSPSGGVTGGSPIQTVTTGTGYLSVPAGDTSVTVTPSPGYMISMVVLDGAQQSISTAGGELAVPQAGKTSRSLIAYFTPATYTMTASQSTGGTVMMQRIYPTTGSYSTTSLSSLLTGQVVRVTAAPNTDFTVTSINIGGGSVWTGNSAASQYYDYTVQSSSPTVSAAFVSIPLVTARMTTSTTRVAVNSSITFDASATTSNDPPLSYRFSVISGDAAKATLSPATASSNPVATFQASTPGEYQVQVTATTARGATSTATSPLLTVLTASEWGSGACISCHSTWPQVPPFRLSTHYLTAGVSCPDCHNPDGALGHPYLSQPTGSCLSCHSTVTPQVTIQYLASPHGEAAACTGCHTDHSARAGFNVCDSCHVTLYAANSIHHNGAASLGGICQGCHLQHSFATAATPEHFNGYTSAANPGFAASYVTPATACANCHLTADGAPDPARDDSLLLQRAGWASSGHGDTRGAGWTARDFKTLSGCVQCHTSKGFIAYSSARAAGAWGAADSARDVLSCEACHTDISTGAMRRATPLQPYGGDSFVNPDLGSSNLCLRCHSGTQSGRSIKALAAANADFSSIAFTGSHSSAAAGVLLKSAGYQFAFRNYSNSWHFKHDRIGVNHFKAYGYDTGSGGPCVGCHMTSTNRHSFRAISDDASGAVISIDSGSCARCHAGPASLNPGRMNVRRAKYAAVLLALQKVLEARGVYYADAEPYFFRSAGDTSPGNAVTDWGNADTMGAAFNFSLLKHEPAAYAHNMIYTKRLIYDSIDFLDNGALDSSVAAAVNGLSGLDATEKATAVKYLAPSGARP